MIGDRRLPLVLLAVAAACSGVLLIVLGSRLTFYIDDWDLLLHRPGFSIDAFLDPHVGHNVASVVAIYKLLQESVGTGSITPYVVVSILCFLTSAVVLFAYLRSRIGDWLALAGAVSMLFLGSAYEDLLIPFQISFYVPVACGLGALMAVERRTKRGDLLACGLLVLALTFSGLALAFTVGCAILIAFDRDRFQRLWVVVVPVALFALWFLGWGHNDPQSQRSLHNVAVAPIYVLDSFASAVSALLGLATPRDEAAVSPVDWGRPILAAVVVLGAVVAIRRGCVSPGLGAAVGAALTFWLLSAVNADEFRLPTVSRYIYPGAIFALMIAAEVVRGIRPGLRALTVVFAVVGLAALSNLEALRQNYNQRVASTPVIDGGLGALDIAADTADPGLVLDEKNSNFAYFGLIDAGSYLAASAKYGSLGYSPEELESAPEPGRVAADKVLATALGLQIDRSPGVAVRTTDCRRVDLGPTGSAEVALAPGGVLVHASADGDAELTLRRYSTESFPVGAGTISPGEAEAIAIPTDRADRPWQLRLGGSGVISVCEPAG